MASVYFANLASSIKELKRIYLDAALLISGPPSQEQQELARAFVVFAHAELEQYVEDSLKELVRDSVTKAGAGNYGKSTIAMLTFTKLESQSGGNFLVGKTSARTVATRMGTAASELIKLIDSNHGVQEKYLAAMAIPLGLDGSAVDKTWLNDLNTFCEYRGAYAHMSRVAQRANPLAVNPKDMWKLCETLVWTNPATASPGSVSSFESFDDWIQGELAQSATSASAPAWKIKLSHWLTILVAAAGRRLKN